MISKSQFKKNLRKEKERLKNLAQRQVEEVPVFHNISNTEEGPTTSRPSIPAISNEIEVIDSVSVGLEYYEPKLDEKLKLWFLEYNPTVKCTTSLLKILKSENLKVPISVNGLIGRNLRCRKRTVSPGEYVHIGLKRQLEKYSDIIENSMVEQILIDIGIDGLPLYKSSDTNSWPILGCIVNIENCGVFLIGSYVGPKKPVDVNCYLHDFVNDFSGLKQDGLIVNNKIIDVKIRAFICDAPARSFVCGVKEHMSLNGCHKCAQVGKKVDYVTTYCITEGEKRTDEDFKMRIYTNYHRPMYCNSEMKLESIGIKMVSQFPLDSMHLLDLGITKKIILRILDRKTILPISDTSPNLISEKLCSLKCYMPKEFNRKCRTFSEIRRYKATEFRQVVLYTGIVIFKGFIPDEIYEHFLLLHCVYRILLSSPNETEINMVQEMVKTFVEMFPALYGRSSVTYNVHSLLHLTECVEQFGNVSSFSAYKFEDYLQKIKKKIRMPKHICQQLYNKFSKDTVSLKTPPQGLTYERGHLTSIFLPKGYFSTKTPDNICLLNNKTFLKIVKIVSEKEFKANAFINIQNFFNHPLNSLDLNIAFVQEEESEGRLYNTEHIMAKVVQLPYQNGFVLIPEIHSFS